MVTVFISSTRRPRSGRKTDRPGNVTQTCGQTIASEQGSLCRATQGATEQCADTCTAVSRPPLSSLRSRHVLAPPESSGPRRKESPILRSCIFFWPDWPTRRKPSLVVLFQPCESCKSVSQATRTVWKGRTRGKGMRQPLPPSSLSLLRLFLFLYFPSLY